MSENQNPIQTVQNVLNNLPKNQRDNFNNGSATDTPGVRYIARRSDSQSLEKRKIARYIVEKYIRDLDAVAIDAGSTQQQIIEKMMAMRYYLSILTNNMTAFRKNSNQEVTETANEFILTGGKYVDLFDALHGEETLNSFNSFNPNVVIIGVSGLVAEKGFLCHGNDEVRVKKLLLTKTLSRIIIPVDYNKLGRMDSYSFGDLEDFRNNENTNNKVIVVCPPIPPDKNDKKSDKQYKQFYTSFENQVKKIEKVGITLDFVPNNILNQPEI